MNEIPSDFYGFGSSFPAFITVVPGFCNSLLVVQLTVLMQSLCLAQKAAVKWNSVPGDINISLILTLSHFLPLITNSTRVKLGVLRGMLNTTHLMSGLRMFP